MTKCNSHELSHIFRLWRCNINIGKCKIAGQRASTNCKKAQYHHNTELHLKSQVVDFESKIEK